MLDLKPYFVARTIKYSCGCIGEFVVIGGITTDKNDWNITPCSQHSPLISQVYQRLDNDWKLYHNGKL